MHIKFHIKIQQEDGEIHRYVVDLFFVILDQFGKEQRWLIEIKPYNQSVPPKATKRKNPTKLLNDMIIYKRNQDKWNAAIHFCKARRMEICCLDRKTELIL